MTITKEIPSDQIRSLDLHQGDNLRVLSEQGSVALVQIVRAQKPKRGAATEWVRKYTGVAKLGPGETVDSIRVEHYREKYGL